MIRILAVFLFVACSSALAQPLGPNEGEVMDIDPAAGEIMIRHGYLPELSMDPMTMVFAVADPSLLRRVRKGDRVTFKAGLAKNGRFAVVAITPVKPKRKESP